MRLICIEFCRICHIYRHAHHVLFVLFDRSFVVVLHFILSSKTKQWQSVVNRGSYMSAHVLLNLLNELGKRDKMRGLPSILSLFRNEFNKFNNTRARM